MDESQNEEKNVKSPSRPNWLLIALTGAFVIAAGVTAVLTFFAVRDLVASWDVTDLPGIVVSSRQTDTPQTTGDGDPGAAVDLEEPLQSAGPTPEPWDGASRVNLLVMGLDYRDWESDAGAPRTDTMILLSIDPLTRSAGVLSIPRDLWVTIPGFEPNRINTAYRFGEIYEYPGGGPELAMQTVEALLGLDVDYYAQIDFNAFERFIDEIDGVKLEIQEPIEVDPIGPKLPRELQPGRQVLTGELALAYARARNTEGADFDRAQRQQQVIMAIRDRLLTPEALLLLIRKAPLLYDELASGVSTNLSLDQGIRLAWLARQIPEENIKRGVIGPPEHVTFGTSPDGEEVLRPVPAQIRILRDEVFTASGPVSPVAVDADPQELMQEEEARVTVLNGTLTPGLASRTADYLTSQGVTVVNPGNATDLYGATNIIDYTGNPYTVGYLVDLMEISQNNIYQRYDPASEVDVVVLLGNDWASNENLP